MRSRAGCTKDPAISINDRRCTRSAHGVPICASYDGWVQTSLQKRPQESIKNIVSGARHKAIARFLSNSGRATRQQKKPPVQGTGGLTERKLTCAAMRIPWKQRPQSYSPGGFSVPTMATGVSSIVGRWMNASIGLPRPSDIHVLHFIDELPEWWLRPVFDLAQKTLGFFRRVGSAKCLLAMSPPLHRISQQSNSQSCRSQQSSSQQSSSQLGQVKRQQRHESGSPQPSMWHAQSPVASSLQPQPGGAGFLLLLLGRAFSPADGLGTVAGELSST
jgi:hypothetical protein